MVGRVLSVAPIGVDGAIVEVESDAKRGLPALQIVGLGNKAIEESKERVRSAIANSLLDFPTTKLTINLAPAELPKDGTHYDTAIALAILCVSGQLTQQQLNDAIFVGELSLDGSARAVRGIITIVETAIKAGVKSVYLPRANLAQAQLVKGVDLIPFDDLKELFLILKQEARPAFDTPSTPRVNATSRSDYLLDQVLGQAQAKRALIIATAGRHNILFSGSPGSGKTLLAKTLVNLLPPLSDEEIIAVTKIHSLAGKTNDTVVDERPFRAPHHSASRTALIGGGTKPIPGEISLSHHGVLFLDEAPEYPRSLLESLRQPLEDKVISINRIGGNVTYPADFMLIATMNPCPCGNYGDQSRECTCSSSQILNYKKKLSGPFLDRIDMTITVARVPSESLLSPNTDTKIQHTNALRLIKTAQLAQKNRYRSSDKHNGSVTTNILKRHAALASDSENLLMRASDKLALSARSYFKVIRVARTIADLDGSATVEPQHVSEALQYRQTI